MQQLAPVESPAPSLVAATRERALVRPQRRETLRTILLVGLVLAGALAVRLVSWQAAYGHSIRADELDYVIPAEMLTRTGRYVDTFQSEGRTWTRVPLDGLLLAAAFATQPPVPPGTAITDTALMTPRFAAGNLALIVVSLVLVGLVMWLAGEAVPAHRRSAALLAGAGTALYPPLVNSAAQQLLSETLFITLIFAAIGTLTRWRPRRGAWIWLVNTGLLLGLAALTRPVAVTFLPFVALWLWMVNRNQKSEIRNQTFAGLHGLRAAVLGTLVVGGALFVAITPWTIYNYKAYGRVLLLDTANVTAFWHYNNYNGEDENAPLRALPNPADRQALIVQKAISNIVAHPDRFVRNVSDSLGYAWHLELQSALQPNAWDLTARDPDVPEVLLTDVAFLAVSLAGLAGLAGLGGRPPVDQAGRVRRALLLWVGCVLALGAIIPYDARYRMPAAPALIIFAAGLLVSVDWRRVVNPRRWITTIARRPWVVGGASVLCVWAIVGALTPRIPPAIQALALVWQAEQAGDPARAAALHQAAIAALPTSFWPYRAAADADRRAGLDDEARRLYAQARPLGEDPRGVLGFADLAYQHPEWQLTADEQRGLQLNPNNLRGAPWNSFQATPPSRLTLGADRDLGYIQGFQGTEQLGTALYRWSDGAGEVRLPAPVGSGPATALRLRLAVPPIGPPDPWPITIRVDGAAPVTLQVGPAWADYTVPLRPAVSGLLHLHLDSPVRVPHLLNPASPDQRVLGVGVQWIERSDAP